MTTETTVKHDVKDMALAAHGRARIEWAATQMPVLAADPRALRARAAPSPGCASPPACM